MARRRGRTAGSVTRLVATFDRFDEAAADREMEESIAVRSVERAVDELMIPALDAAAERLGRGAELEGACRWATGWLHRARGLAPAAWRDEGVLLLEADPGPSVDSVHTQALDLALRRLGLRVLVLSTGVAGERIGPATAALRPGAVVICGAEAGEELRGLALEGVMRSREAGEPTATAPLPREAFTRSIRRPSPRPRRSSKSWPE